MILFQYPLDVFRFNLPQEISNRSLFPGIDISFGEDAKRQHLRKPKGIMTIICILKSFVLLDRCRIGQMHAIISSLIQPIYQSVPVKCALDSYPPDLLTVRG